MKTKMRIVAFLMAAVMVFTGVPFGAVPAKAADEKIVLDFGMPTQGLVGEDVTETGGMNPEGYTSAPTYQLTTSLAGEGWSLNAEKTTITKEEGSDTLYFKDAGKGALIHKAKATNTSKEFGGPRISYRVACGQTIAFDFQVASAGEYDLQLVYIAGAKAGNMIVNSGTDYEVVQEGIIVAGGSAGDKLSDVIRVNLVEGTNTVEFIGTETSGYTSFRALYLTKVEAEVEPTEAPTEAPTEEPVPTPEPTQAPVAAPEVRPEIPAELGAAVFAETFEDEEYTEGFSFSGAGWDRSVMNGYALVEKDAVKQAYFDVVTPTITNGTAAVYQTDFYLADINSQFRVMLFTTGTTTSTLDRFYVENGSLVYGDYAQALEADTWYTLSVIFDYANGRAYYYLNDTCFGIKEDAANISMDSQLTKVRVNATEAYMANNFVACYDNVAVYEATVTEGLPVPTPVPTPAPTEEPTPTPEPTMAPVAAPEVRPEIPAKVGAVVFAETFEDEALDITFNNDTSWVRTLLNGYLLCERGTGKQAYFDVVPTPITNGTATVFQADFYLADINSPFRFMTFTDTTASLDKIYVYGGNLVYGEYTQALEVNTWYTLSIIFDYENGNAFYYLNDACVGVLSDPANISMDRQLVKVRVNYADKLNDIEGFLANNFVACYDNVAVYEAVLDESIIMKNYDISFVDEDGTVLYEVSVKEGEVPVYEGAEPVKEADAQYTYTFIGWDKEVVAAAGNEIYTAVYEATVNEYTVTWMNFDGTVLATETYKYGETPEYKGETPVYGAYTFTGWSPAVAEVKGDATYTAQFEMKGASIEWFDEDGDGKAETGYYYVDGAVKKGAGLVQVGDYLYWVLSTGKISVGTNRTIKANQTNGLIEAGTYYFFNNGVLATQEVKLAGEIRWTEEKGKQVGYYYVQDEICKDVGLVELYNPEAEEETWYYVLYSGKVKKNNVADGKRVNHTVKAEKANLYPGGAGLYSFYESAVMYDPLATETGIVKYDEAGKPWYYVDGHIRKDAGLVLVTRGDLKGNYIFVTYSGTLKKGTQSVKENKCNGHTEFVGTQRFDNNTGAMIIK